MTDEDVAPGHRSIELGFTNDAGRRLAGTLELPVAVGPPPVVVFAHGVESSRASSRNRAIAERLLVEGIAAYRFDFTGHGESEGTREEATIDRMVADLAGALETMKQHNDVDPARIGVSGSGTGGVVALHVAARDERVRVLVLRSVPADGLDDVAREVRVPTLVIAGEHDWPVVSEGETLASLIAADHSFVVIPEAGRLFEGHGQAAHVALLSAKWFADHLTLGAVAERQ